MSEQDMSLDTAIELFRLVRNFDEYKEGLREVLTRCHTHEELEKAKAVIDEEKNRLLDTNEEFKAIMDRRKQQAKRRADENRAIHQAKVDEITADAMSKVRMRAISDPDIEEWVARTKFKTVDPEELEKKMDDKLGCPNPKCDEHGKNRGNIVNDVPTCMCCWHRLVPKSKFKDYNRRYWRRFNRKRKKKRKS